MSKLIDSIVNRNYVEADSIVSEAVELIMAKKLEEAKKMCAAKMDEQIPAFMGAPGSDAVKLRRDVLEEDDIEEEDLEEDEQLDEARIKLIKARIRGGKIQRRKRVSNVPGMTIRGGKLQRMSPAERRRRKMGQRRGKIKRKAKMNRAIMKRQRSLRKRKALGI